MADRAYFLVNDTRYDNHHGGLTVIRNLHAAMAARGWTCSGSLPVSARAKQLTHCQAALHKADLIIVNGEGSLHHNSRNTRRLLAICQQLQKTHPIALINTTWQSNDPQAWKPVLDACIAVYARDHASCEQLNGMGVAAHCAPDLTFYDYPTLPRSDNGRWLGTDSVVAEWTAWMLDRCDQNADMDFATLFTRHLHYTRGMRDATRRLKYTLYPAMGRYLPTRIPARYRALGHAVDRTETLLAQMASARAVCAARYHALCFALQQNVPFVAIPSNSHKTEALLTDVGLPADLYLYDQAPDRDTLRRALERVATAHAEHTATIQAFNASARQQIDAMFDAITSMPAPRQERP